MHFLIALVLILLSPSSCGRRAIADDAQLARSAAWSRAARAAATAGLADGRQARRRRRRAGAATSTTSATYIRAPAGRARSTVTVDRGGRQHATTVDARARPTTRRKQAVGFLGMRRSERRRRGRPDRGGAASAIVELGRGHVGDVGRRPRRGSSARAASARTTVTHADRHKAPARRPSAGQRAGRSDEHRPHLGPIGCVGIGRFDRRDAGLPASSRSWSLINIFVGVVQPDPAAAARRRPRRDRHLRADPLAAAGRSLPRRRRQAAAAHLRRGAGARSAVRDVGLYLDIVDRHRELSRARRATVHARRTTRQIALSHPTTRWPSAATRRSRCSR